MQCTVSPLAQDAGSLEAGLVAAEAGLPVGYMTMASCASSAPATLAGALLVGNAEVVSALALMQLAAPGAPVYYAAAQTAMDLRTGGLHRRRAGRLPVWGRHQPPGRFLQRAALDGRLCHRRQRARTGRPPWITACRLSWPP